MVMIDIWKRIIGGSMEECECPKDQREYTGFIICHNSRENCYTCKICGKVH